MLLIITLVVPLKLYLSLKNIINLSVRLFSKYRYILILHVFNFKFICSDYDVRDVRLVVFLAAPNELYRTTVSDSYNYGWWVPANRVPPKTAYPWMDVSRHPQNRSEMTKYEYYIGCSFFFKYFCSEFSLAAVMQC